MKEKIEQLLRQYELSNDYVTFRNELLAIFVSSEPDPLTEREREGYYTIKNVLFKL